LPMLTAGDRVAEIVQFLRPGCDSYTALDVINRLLHEAEPVNGKKYAAAYPNPVAAG
jgi:hypothetical protein